MLLLVTNFPTIVNIELIIKIEETEVVGITRLRYKCLKIIIFHFVIEPYGVTEREVSIDRTYVETYIHKEIEDEIFLTNNFDFLEQPRFNGYRTKIKKMILKDIEKFTLEEL